MEVYFFTSQGGDNFKVTHTKSPVIQVDDYYPFGLSFNSYQRTDQTKNKYLYNVLMLRSFIGVTFVMKTSKNPYSVLLFVDSKIERVRKFVNL